MRVLAKLSRPFAFKSDMLKPNLCRLFTLRLVTFLGKYANDELKGRPWRLRPWHGVPSPGQAIRLSDLTSCIDRRASRRCSPRFHGWPRLQKRAAPAPNPPPPDPNGPWLAAPDRADRGAVPPALLCPPHQSPGQNRNSESPHRGRQTRGLFHRQESDSEVSSRNLRSPGLTAVMDQFGGALIRSLAIDLFHPLRHTRVQALQTWLGAVGRLISGDVEVCGRMLVSDSLTTGAELNLTVPASPLTGPESLIKAVPSLDRKRACRQSQRGCIGGSVSSLECCDLSRLFLLRSPDSFGCPRNSTGLNQKR